MFKKILLPILLLLTIGVNAQNDKATLDSLIRTIVNDFKLPSLSLVACKGDSVIYANAYGLKKKNDTDSVSIHSKYYWGSVSKVFTASAIMQLNERGKLQLNTPAIKYYPELKYLIKKGKYSPEQITIYHLLTHTAGLPKFSRSWLLTDKRNNLPIEESLKIGDIVELSSRPGKKHKYSNMGMQILGVIIERISGLSYPEYMQRNIFTPLELKESTFEEVNNKTDSSLATLHTWDNQKNNFIVQDKLVYCNSSSSGGGIKMSPNDMGKWLIECMKIYHGQNSFITNHSIKKMWTRSKSHKIIGLGWNIENYFSLGNSVGKGGNLEWMSQSYILIFPKQKIAISIVTNATNDNFWGKNSFANKLIKEASKL